MLLGTGATLIATLLCATAWNLGSLLVFRFAQGLSIPFIFAVAVAYIADECAGPAAAAANTLYIAGTAFGGFCGRFLSGAAAARFGWRLSFVPLAVVVLVTLLAVAAWLPREQRWQRSPSLLASLRGLGRHLGNARLMGTCFVGASILFLQVGSFTYAGLRLEAPPFRLNSFQIGAVFAVFLVAVVVTPLTGRLIVHMGRRRTFALANLVSLAGIGVTLMPAVPAVVAGLAGSSTGVFSGQACATGYAAESAGSARSGAVGLYLTSYYAGGSIGAIAPAPLYARAGWNGCAALLVAVIGAGTVAALISWPARSGRNRGVST
jgi:predicted MFS family arabinose efflux permease